ncbi:MAG TPA: zf-TFIIB domain-containing protein [Longimicrobium sp.]|jgi:Zn-finger nucleic acid-binding protein|uniref:TFIIB-type zinc ribbon-containing protein n=1 Tax=Longimicrobium sp. TaxID=2029185 RepID=UPI002EDA1905
MTDTLTRLACPACLGVVLQKVPVRPGLHIDHCPRCGGNWILDVDAPRLVAVPEAAACAALGGRSESSYLCHGCQAPLKRNAPRCKGCGFPNVLQCPGCGTAMSRKQSGGVTLDVCGPCRGVWLDHAELVTLWTAAIHAAVGTRSAGGVMELGLHGADALFEVLWYAPDLAVSAVEVTGHAVSAGWEAASVLPEIVAEAPGVLLWLLEAAGDAAGAVFGLIAEILGSLDF